MKDDSYYSTYAYVGTKLLTKVWILHIVIAIIIRVSCFWLQETYYIIITNYALYAILGIHFWDSLKV